MKHKNIKLIITLLIFIITISIIFNTNKKSSKITDSSTKFEKIPIANKTVTVQWNENSPKVTIHLIIKLMFLILMPDMDIKQLITTVKIFI